MDTVREMDSRRMRSTLWMVEYNISFFLEKLVEELLASDIQFMTVLMLEMQ